MHSIQVGQLLSCPPLSCPVLPCFAISLSLLSSPLPTSSLVLPLMCLSSCYHFFLPSFINHLSYEWRSCLNSSSWFGLMISFDTSFFSLGALTNRERTGVHPMPRTYALLVRCANAHLGQDTLSICRLTLSFLDFCIQVNCSYFYSTTNVSHWNWRFIFLE